jgi:hypothetical protein
MNITSLTKELRAEINRANAQKSTGPKSPEGKQRASMNACRHNLSGQNLILQPAEMEAYNRLAAAMLSDLNPKSEPERQIAEKVIDTHFRLNRLAGLENNIFNFGLLANETQTPHDDRLEVMIAQTRAWIERSSSFDVLGRYESRLTRQLLKYQEEFERLQAVRKEREHTDANRSHKEIKRDTFNVASFRQAASELPAGPDTYRILTGLHSPKPSTPQEAAMQA